MSRAPRAASNYPSIEFRAGLDGEKQRNVNFARQEAERQVEVTGECVTLYRIVGGNEQVMVVCKPKQSAEVIQMFPEKV